MLLRFTVFNYRSILDPVELSMIAIDGDRPAARTFERLKEKVVPVAGVLGPNASGKSNLLHALAWLSNAVRLSLRQWGETIPRDPHRFSDGVNRSSRFELDFMANEVRYTYVLEVDDEQVLYESLCSYPELRRRVIFERESESLHFRRGTEGQVAIRELLTPTTLLLSAALRYDPDISNAARFVTSMRAQGSRVPIRLDSRNRRLPLPRGVSTESYFDEEQQRREPQLFEFDDEPAYSRDAALALLQVADLGIEGVEIVERELDEERRYREVQLLHRSNDRSFPLRFEEESEGTKTWFRLIGPVLEALTQGRLLVFDEIDASLHPRLSAQLLELFQDPATNPKNAQLVFTTHDTSLLSSLNRDEVWLTEKGKDGATTLTALADYNGTRVRQSVNLERAYLQGRFGAVPEIDQVLVRHALGLIP